MKKVYNDFAEVEQDIKENAPPIVYKFRTWENEDHKRIITNNEVWFAHPFSLNDPYDMRPPVKFIIEKMDPNFIKSKIRDAGRAIEIDMNPAELELKVEERFEQIMKDPHSYFKQNEDDYNKDDAHYNQIGLLSCCRTCENEAMWAHYGNNHTGFAIGFNTVEFARALYCTMQYVEYSNDPIEYNPFGNNEEFFDAKMRRKSLKWQEEDEIRFTSAGIGIIRTRLAKFPPKAAAEIVFGLKTTKDFMDEIKNEASKTMPYVEYYQVQKKQDAFGFDKVKI